MTTPNLYTERLTLRPFREEDAEALFALCREPELGRNAGWKPHESLEESREVLHTVFLNREHVWALALPPGNPVIGAIALMDDPTRNNPEAKMLGYWTARPQWGKGYMTEAARAVVAYGFTQLHLPLITANCYPHNIGSQKVLRHNGFQQEGLLHQAAKTNWGEVFDLQCYYLTRTMFEQNRTCVP